MDATRESHIVVKEKEKELTDQHKESYHPLKKTMLQWSDQKNIKQVPLSSSNVFVYNNHCSYDQNLIVEVQCYLVEAIKEH